MKQFDLLGIGNSVVDVLYEVDETFIKNNKLEKDVMTIIDEEKAEKFYSQLKQGIEVAGGSVAKLTLDNTTLVLQDDLTVGELTLRGYYLGSNVSYNVKKMVENDYLVQERSLHDKRSMRVKLSEKGRELHDIISEMYVRHETKLQGTELGGGKLDEMIHTMKMLENFWVSQTNFTGLASLEDL